MREDFSPTNDSQWQWNCSQKEEKFIAFINALLTLAYCMTNCFRKPSTKVIPYVDSPKKQILFIFSVSLEQKKLSIFSTSNSMLPHMRQLHRH